MSVSQTKSFDPKRLSFEAGHKGRYLFLLYNHYSQTFFEKIYENYITI